MKNKKEKITLSNYPELVKEFHPTLNGNLKPEDITYGSKKKIWWICSKNPDHYWYTIVHYRTKGSRCPYCSNRKVTKENCIQTTHPKLCLEWNWKKNGNLSPKNFVKSSTKKVMWQCLVNPDHEWEASISNRIYCSTGCPYCSGHKIHINDSLKISHPEVCELWHYRKNHPLIPQDVNRANKQRVWWICSKGHEFESKICNKVKQPGCPFCPKRKLDLTKSLFALYPEQCKKFWDYELNSINPKKIAAKSSKRVYFKCPIAADHKWCATINDTTRYSFDCPFCLNHRPSSTNNLASFKPELIKEWDFVKNPKPPSEYTRGSEYKAWWICSTCNNNWQATINDRANQYHGCRFCKTTSIGEKLILEHLKTININFSQQYVNKLCKYKRNLPFDFAIHEKQFGLIEYQGQQHFIPVKNWGGEKEFQKRQIKDQIKRDFCKNNNIPLLEILYTQIKEIPTLLTNFILQLQS